MLNFDFIYQKAKESRIDSITIQREYWQLLLLQKIYSMKLSENLYFKGGTAIRFLMNSFRFSEDLDFTSTGEKNTMERLLLEVFRYYQKNSGPDLEFKKEKIMLKFEENSLKYRFLFKPRNSSQKVSVRIDVSFREKPVTKKETILIPFDYPISPYPLTVHLSPEEMFAEKIRALFVRSKPRDVFDIWYLLTKKTMIDLKIIKNKFRLYPEVAFSKNKLKEIIRNYDEFELKKDLNQFLPEQYRNFYKNLKNQTLDALNQIKNGKEVFIHGNV